MANELPDIPRNMRKVQRRFEQWRSAHAGVRLPIPKRLWAVAAELAREHGVFPTAKALRLEYGKLKQLMEAPRHPEATAPARFQNGALGRSRAASPAAKRAVRKAPMSRAPRAGSTAPPAFGELMAPRSVSSQECRVELEGPRGRMRIDFKGVSTAELVVLSRALWDGETR
jgi:hypothetical protein